MNVVGAMLQIADMGSLEKRTRHSPTEFVIAIVEGRKRADKIIRKMPQFICRMCGILLKMLLDIYDEVLWHSVG